MDNNFNSTWNDNYKIGIPNIDEQHEVFFNIYDELLTYNDNNISSDKMLIIIKKLIDYIATHFKYEEELMKASNYDETNLHIIQHKFFEKKINELILAHKYNNSQLFSQLLTFVRKWFLSHISQVDFKYKDIIIEYIKNNP